jgi:hypothetical protein
MAVCRSSNRKGQRGNVAGLQPHKATACLLFIVDCLLIQSAMIQFTGNTTHIIFE